MELLVGVNVTTTLGPGDELFMGRNALGFGAPTVVGDGAVVDKIFGSVCVGI